MNRALLIHGGALGDFVLSLCVMNFLRHAGASQVSYLTRSQMLPLARWAGAAEAFDLETSGFHVLFSQETLIPASVKSVFAGVDLVVNMLGEALSVRLRREGVPRVIDIDPRPSVGRDVHISEQWIDVLGAHGLSGDPGQGMIRVPAADRVGAKEILRSQGGSPGERIAILHPGSGSSRKNWPMENFLRLAVTVRALGLSPVFLLGPVEEERLTQQAAQSLRDAGTVVKGLSTRELAAVLTQAVVFVGNDSGVTHLAAAVGAPTVAIFGRTSPVVWRPLGSQVHVVQDHDAGWPGVERVSDVLKQASTTGA